MRLGVHGGDGVLHVLAGVGRVARGQVAPQREGVLALDHAQVVVPAGERGRAAVHGGGEEAAGHGLGEAGPLLPVGRGGAELPAGDPIAGERDQRVLNGVALVHRAGPAGLGDGVEGAAREARLGEGARRLAGLLGRHGHHICTT
jgi:hypothetical protein